MVAPLLLLLIFGTIDFSGYFGSRLSVENAARAGARVAATEAYTAYPGAGTAIVSTISAQDNVGHVPTATDCTWSGYTLNPSSYPPFTFSGAGCIGIWYFELSPSGSPWLCAQWNVGSSSWIWWDAGGVAAASRPTGCVAPGSDLVVVGVGFHYDSITPLPTIAEGALDTYGETQLLEEQ